MSAGIDPQQPEGGQQVRHAGVPQRHVGADRIEQHQRRPVGRAFELPVEADVVPRRERHDQVFPVMVEDGGDDRGALADVGADVGRCEVAGDRGLVDIEALGDGRHRLRRSCREQEEIGEHRPLRLPAAEPALLLGGQRRQKGRDQPGRAQRSGKRDLAAGGVALVRHRRRSAAPRDQRFARFAHAVLREQRDVARELAERADQDAECAGDGRDPDAARVPGDAGREAKLVCHATRDAGAPAVKPGAGAGGAAELDLGVDRDLVFEAACGVVDAGCCLRQPKPEPDRHRILQQRPPDRRRPGMALGERVQRDADPPDIGREQARGPSHLQHQDRVGDVLAGRAAMDPLRRLARRRRTQARDQRDR